MEGPGLAGKARPEGHDLRHAVALDRQAPKGPAQRQRRRRPRSPLLHETLLPVHRRPGRAPGPVHVKTPEEIAASNAELAAARKARKAAQQAAATTAPAPAAPTIPAPAPTPEPSKPAAVVAVVEHHTLHDDAPAPEPVQLDFASIAAQVLA